MKAGAFSQCTLLEDAEHPEPKHTNPINGGSHFRPIPTLLHPLSSFPSSISLEGSNKKGKQC